MVRHGKAQTGVSMGVWVCTRVHLCVYLKGAMSSQKETAGAKEKLNVQHGLVQQGVDCVCMCVCVCVCADESKKKGSIVLVYV